MRLADHWTIHCGIYSKQVSHTGFHPQDPGDPRFVPVPTPSAPPNEILGYFGRDVDQGQILNLLYMSGGNGPIATKQKSIIINWFN